MLPDTSAFSNPPIRCSRPAVPGTAHGRANVTGSRRNGSNTPPPPPAPAPAPLAAPLVAVSLPPLALLASLVGLASSVGLASVVGVVAMLGWMVGRSVMVGSFQGSEPLARYP